MTIDYIRELLDLMRVSGVDSFKYENLEVSFSPANRPTSIEPSPEERREALAKLLKAENDSQDEDLLWST